MDSNEIRRQFLGFFEERGHRVVPSSSLISPVPGLLLTNAGMNQFVPYFMGVEEPPYPRAATAQKVFRTADIELVGQDARHLTFFEMLGNFSFGDYFKREAIRWAHELVTEGFGIDHDRLWATVYETDDEAVELWIEEGGLAPERIVRRGKADNFWWTHTAGPCGPCSEIYVDRGPKYGPDGGPNVDEDRFLEIWNLVFMQNECDERSNVVGDLPKKNIDTGSSLERVALVLQDADTVFETDLFRPLVETAERLTGRRYGRDEQDDVHLRVMAEHGRATAFLVADGVLPSNEGRGYVLRRMLRRLVTYARRLGLDRPVMADLVEATAAGMGETYPELVANKAFILQVLSSEEERFAGTLRQGLAVFEQAVRSAASVEPAPATISGEAAFKLHDTFGFPLELTIELAAEAGLGVDTDAFARLMEDQRERARAAQKKGDPAEGILADLAAVVGPTEFVGYERLSGEARVVGMASNGSQAESAGEGTAVRVILDRTPFYAEGGGQVGDAGRIRTSGGEIEVTDTRPGPGGTVVHQGRVVSGEVRQGDEAEAVVDEDRRAATARSHTATHVLHHTIRVALGEHARQAGSLVAPGRLRFDFTHYEAVPRDALEEIEYLVNRRLADDQPVRAYETTYDFARSEGAIALFGEKYGDLVRVVEVGDYSVELCGGTHVRHTGEVALVRLVSEASIGSGFRRVEAVTGPDALRQVNLERRLLEEVVGAVGGGDPNAAPERVRQAVARIKALESELGKLRKGERQQDVERLAAEALDVAGVALVVGRLDGAAAGELREAAVAVKDRLEPRGLGAVVLGSVSDGKAVLVAASTNELVARGVRAPALLEPAARAIGGNAGGRPNIASGGGPNGAAMDTALGQVPGRLAELLGAT
jgi:alanyl-tRNA synthetase